MLYIILLLVAAFVGWSYIKAKARVLHANQVQALRKLSVMEKNGTLDQVPYPSWISNKSRLEEFIAMVRAATKQKGVPESFFLEMMSNINDRSRLMLLAGMMEKNRSSFNEQAMTVSDMIIGSWSQRSSAPR